jgi:hypothetical protein
MPNLRFILRASIGGRWSTTGDREPRRQVVDLEAGAVAIEEPNDFFTVEAILGLSPAYRWVARTGGRPRLVTS